jgi:hypothetical protein
MKEKFNFVCWLTMRMVLDPKKRVPERVANKVVKTELMFISLYFAKSMANIGAFT